MIRMLGIGHGGEEFLMARKASDILGWASSGDFNQSWMELARHRVTEFADFDFVFPVVAEVVDVVNCLSAGVLDHIP